MLHLQKHFWDTAKLVCRTRSNYGELFNAKRDITQGGPLSSLMFNLCVDAIVREWLHQTIDEGTAQDGISDQVAEILVVFMSTTGSLLCAL